MATVSITNDKLHIRLSGWEAFFALQRSVTVRLSSIVRAEAGTVTKLRPDGIRLPGTFIPGVIAAGSYWWKGHGWSFWSVRKPEKAVDIRLQDAHYWRIVVQLDDPYSVATMIEDAIRRQA